SDTVIIAGGGPVGLMLACELGLAGVDTVVLERHDAPREPSRGGAINATVVELFTQRGIMESLRDDGFEFRMAHFAHIPLAPERVPGDRAFSFAVPHAQVERRLEERARSLGVRVRRSTEITSVRQTPDGVQVTTGDGEVVEGAYLVGCDGSASLVREQAGIPFPGVDPDFHGLWGDIKVEPGAPVLERIGARQYELGLCMVAPIGPDTVRVITGEFDVPSPPADQEVGFDELRAAVARIAGVELDGVPGWLSRWTATSRQAERYREGRILLAGDAAHTLFPLGGQALGTGIEDAVNLGWKLAATVQGWAPPSLLDSYHEERHAAGARACASTRAQTTIMRSLARVGELRALLTELAGLEEVNAYLVRMVGGIDGSRLPDVPLVTAEGETSVYRLLEAGRGVLLDLGAGLPAVRHPQVTYVRAEPTNRLDATAVLLRPDGVVAWRAPQDGLEAALETWFGPAA
nr:Chain A, PyrE3 [Streptomyces rugosporus]5XGV_B Chain B, PyrE3 [Streptomyces rugosporus]